MLRKYNLEYSKNRLELVLLLAGVLVAALIAYLIFIQHGSTGF